MVSETLGTERILQNTVIIENDVVFFFHKTITTVTSSSTLSQLAINTAKLSRVVSEKK